MVAEMRSRQRRLVSRTCCGKTYSMQRRMGSPLRPEASASCRISFPSFSWSCAASTHAAR